MATLPPFPANAMPGGWVWTDWWKKFQDYVKEVTEVIGEGTATGNVSGLTAMDTGSMTPISLPTTVSIYWSVVANFLMFRFDIDLPTGINVQITANNARIEFNSTSEDTGMPRPVRTKTIGVAMFNETTEATRSIGVGVSVPDGNGGALCLPNFVVTSNTHDLLIVSGDYFVE